MISTKPFTETWADFTYGWPRVKWPKGNGHLKTAIANALEAKYPIAEEADYDIPEVQLLVRVFYELQRLVGDAPIWISSRDAEGFLGVCHTQANRLIQMLEADEILVRVEDHTAKRSTRYRYTGQNLSSDPETTLNEAE